MPNPLYTYISNMYGWVGLGRFYGILTPVGNLILNPLYTYISNIYGWVGLVWLGFMAYQPV